MPTYRFQLIQWDMGAFSVSITEYETESSAEAARAMLASRPRCVGVMVQDWQPSTETTHGRVRLTRVTYGLPAGPPRESAWDQCKIDDFFRPRSLLERLSLAEENEKTLFVRYTARVPLSCLEQYSRPFWFSPTALKEVPEGEIWGEQVRLFRRTD